MSALNLGQLNIRPETDHELYRNDTSNVVSVSIALTELQTKFTLKCGADVSDVSASGVLTLNIPSGGRLTISHEEKNIMQPVHVQIDVG